MGESNFYDSTLFFHSDSDNRKPKEAQEVDKSFKKHFAKKPKRQYASNDHLDAKLLNQLSKVMSDEAAERYYHLGKHSINLELQVIAKFNNEFFLNALTSEAKKAAIEQVTKAYILVMANYRKKLKDGKLTQRLWTTNPEKQKLEKALVDCQNILGFLHYGKKLATTAQTTPEEFHKAAFYNLWNADKLLNYTGKIIIDGIRNASEKLINNPTVAARELLSDINGHRLYWVWSGGLLNSILPFVPDSLNKARATNEINAPNPVTGNLSVILYVLRFMINFSLVIKHVVAAKTRGESAWSAFKQQMSDRYIVLLNDLVWGAANAATLWFLTYSKSVKLGNIGTFLTSGLLLFDLGLSFAAYRKQKGVYIKELKKFDAQISEYQRLIEEKTDKASELHTGLLGALTADSNDEASKLNAEKILGELMSNFGTYLRLHQLTEKSNNLQKHIDELWNIVANMQNEQDVRQQVYHYCFRNNQDEELREYERVLKDLLASRWIYERNLRSYTPNASTESRQPFTDALMEYLVLNQELRITQKKLDVAIQKRDSIELNWEFDKKEHQNTMIYAASMAMGFSLLLIPIIATFPPASVIPLVLGLVSAALLFTFTLANTIRSGVINVKKTSKERAVNEIKANTALTEYNILKLIEKIHQARQEKDGEKLAELNKQYDKQLEKLYGNIVASNIKSGSFESLSKQQQLFESKRSFLESLRDDTSLPPNYIKQEKQMRYLEMKELTAENVYQKQLARYNKINIVRGALIDALIPALVFAATFTMPLGAGIALMAAAAVIGIASKILIDYKFKPKKEDSHRLDKKEFELFDKKPSLSKFEPEKEDKGTKGPVESDNDEPIRNGYSLSFA